MSSVRAVSSPCVQGCTQFSWLFRAKVALCSLTLQRSRVFGWDTGHSLCAVFPTSGSFQKSGTPKWTPIYIYIYIYIYLYLYTYTYSVQCSMYLGLLKRAHNVFGTPICIPWTNRGTQHEPLGLRCGERGLGTSFGPKAGPSRPPIPVAATLDSIV